jgi:hypothetical protein
MRQARFRRDAIPSSGFDIFIRAGSFQDAAGTRASQFECG